MYSAHGECKFHLALRNFFSCWTCYTSLTCPFVFHFVLKYDRDGWVQVHLALGWFSVTDPPICFDFAAKISTARGECKFTLHFKLFSHWLFCFGSGYVITSASSPCILYISADSDVYFPSFRSQFDSQNFYWSRGWKQAHLVLDIFYSLILCILQPVREYNGNLCKFILHFLTSLFTDLPFFVISGLKYRQRFVSASSPCT